MKPLDEIEENNMSVDLQEMKKLAGIPISEAGEEEDWDQIVKDEAKDVIRQAGKFNQAVQKLSAGPEPRGGMEGGALVKKELWKLMNVISNFIYNAEEVGLPLKDYTKAKKAVQDLMNGIGLAK